MPHDQTHRVLKDAKAIMKKAIQRVPHCPITSFFYANVLADLAATSKDPKKANQLYEEAEKYYQNSSRAELSWKENIINRAACKYDYSLHLNKNGDKKLAKQLWTEADSLYELSKKIETKNTRLIALSDLCLKDCETVRNNAKVGKCSYKMSKLDKGFFQSKCAKGKICIL